MRERVRRMVASILLAALAGLSLWPAQAAISFRQNIARAQAQAPLIAAGGFHTCVVTAQRDVRCWGRNLLGQLGDGTATDRAVPVPVVGLTGGVAAIAAGEQFSCAVLVDRGVECWGDNGYGQLGTGAAGGFEVKPVAATSAGHDVVALAAGADHACALTEAGGVRCWGNNDHGQLGDGTAISHLSPVEVIGLTGGVRAITAGTSYTCALLGDRSVVCWGANENGQLGDGTTRDQQVPTPVAGLPADITVIDAGPGIPHTCALRANGGVLCWGHNVFGQTGTSASEDELRAVAVQSLEPAPSGIAVGGRQTCVAAGSEVWCWGDNSLGELGDGSVDSGPHAEPVQVASTFDQATAVVAGEVHSCVMTSDHRALCWGDNTDSQLGDAALESSALPIEVNLSAPTPTPRPSAAKTKALTLVLGDSVAAGCCGDRAKGFAVLLNAHLSTKAGGQATLVDLGVDNLTSSNFVSQSMFWPASGRVQSQLAEAVAVLMDAKAQNQDVLAITLDIGGNDFLFLQDAGGGGPCYEAETIVCAQEFAATLTTFRMNLDQALAQLDAVKDPSTPLFFINNYDPFDTGEPTAKYHISERWLAQINAASADIVAAHHDHLVDIHPLFAGNAATLISGVDPTVAGHRVIADALIEAYASLEPEGGRAGPGGGALVPIALGVGVTAAVALGVLFWRKLRRRPEVRG